MSWLIWKKDKLEYANHVKVHLIYIWNCYILNNIEGIWITDKSGIRVMLMLGIVSYSNAKCCELTFTHNVIEEGVPFWRTQILPGAQLCNRNIGSYNLLIPKLVRISILNIVLLFSLR